MFSKRAEDTDHQAIPLIPTRSSSIARTLAVLYTVSASGLLAISIVYLYWVLVADLQQVNNTFLFSRISALQMLLKKDSDNREALQAETRIESRGYIRILDEMNRTFLETPGMDDLLPTSLFPSPTVSEKMGENTAKRVRRSEKTFLLMAAWAKEVPTVLKPRRIQVALDVSYEEELKSSYLKRLLIVLFGGILLSSVMGVAITWRELRPLREITQAIKRIKTADLHKRLQPTEWPKELTSLAVGFNRMLSRLDLSFTRLSQFSADLAHELRSPIHNLMGEAEVALSRDRTPEAYREVISSGLEETQRLSRMIDRLLFLARAETEAQLLQASQFKAEEEIADVLEFHDAFAKEHGVTVTSKGSASINADPVLFRRVISNLISNALQYTPRGGKVALNVNSSGDHWVEVRVTDTGCGISQEHLPKVFDRFYRVGVTRSQFPTGLGLGLSIVKSIMDLHKGRVTIQSEINKGTMVVLRFPPPYLS